MLKGRNRWRFLPLTLTGAIVLAVSACGSTGSKASASSTQADDAAIATDFQNHQSNVEVTADGIVVGLFPDRHSSDGTHEEFIIRLTSQNMTLLIEHNISIGRRVPVAQGDHVIVHGEYIWNEQGGLVHFTHHDPQGTHEGGYVIDNGQTYD